MAKAAQLDQSGIEAVALQGCAVATRVATQRSVNKTDLSQAGVFSTPSQTLLGRHSFLIGIGCWYGASSRSRTMLQIPRCKR